MPRRTLKERYAAGLKALDALIEIVTPEEIFDKVGTTVYSIQNLKLYKSTITELRYRTPFYPKDKPTRKDMAAIHEYIYNFKYDQDKTLLCLKGENWMPCKTLKEIEESKFFSFNKEEMEEELQRQKELYEPRLGHKPCSYCRKQTPEETMVERTIINFKMYGRAGKRNKYCSAECGLHDQYAHEG